MFYTIIQKLSTISSRLEKEEVVRQAWISGERQFFELAKLAYDPMITFGVKKIDAETPYDIAKDSITYESFLVLAKQLQDRELTGKAAQSAIKEFAVRCGKQEWEVFRNVLKKDLRCGVTDTLINKILTEQGAPEKYKVAVFHPQKGPSGSCDDRLPKLKGKYIAQFKLNGTRIMAFIDLRESGEPIKLYTFNGIENTNFNYVVDEIRAKIIPWMRDNNLSNLALDGEMMSANFQKLMTLMKRKSEVDTSDSFYNIFDMLTVDEFYQGICNVHQDARMNKVASMLSTIQGGRLQQLDYFEIDFGVDGGIQLLRAYMKEAAKLGLEGVMLKEVDAPYECKRSTNWLKFKPKLTIDLKIVGFEAGKEGKKNANRLGGILGEAEHDGKFIKATVGTGLTEEQREYIWTHQDEFLNEWMEVEADEITKSPDNDYYSLRFPCFMTFRSQGDGKI
jgi:DNA ligase-1